MMAKSIKDEVSVASEEKKESTGAALSPTLCDAILIKTPCLALPPFSDQTHLAMATPRADETMTRPRMFGSKEKPSE